MVSRLPGEGIVDVPAFFIAGREVTVAEFSQFAQAGKWTVDPRAISGPADHPVAFVSWPDAIAYSRWLESDAQVVCEHAAASAAGACATAGT